MRRLCVLPLLFLLVLALPACAETAKTDSGYGPHPALPEPEHALIPTLNTAKAIGWPQGGKPIAAEGLSVSAYVTGLDHPRWIYVLPNGDVLVAETNTPQKPENDDKDSKGIMGAVTKHEHKRAGAGVESANRITLLRGIDENGMAKTRTIFLSGLNSPFGMALVGNHFYVADTDAVLRFPYHNGDTTITGKGVKIADLPAGTINHHWTKNIIASPDGSKLYASAGSNSNAAENGIEAENGRAAIYEIDLKTGKSRIFASGLRNPNGMAWQPQTGVLWTVVNERDELGNNLPPDYLTSVKDGGFYGFPYSYWGQHVDDRVKPQNPDKVAKAIMPDYGLGTHTAPLGLAFYEGNLLPEQYKNGAFIGQHGSWNRDPKVGYRVIFIPFMNGQPAGMPEAILTGFLDKDGNALGRPVGVATDKDDALLVADDVGNAIWRVVPAH